MNEAGVLTVVSSFLFLQRLPLSAATSWCSARAHKAIEGRGQLKCRIISTTLPWRHAGNRSIGASPYIWFRRSFTQLFIYDRKWCKYVFACTYNLSALFCTKKKSLAVVFNTQADIKKRHYLSSWKLLYSGLKVRWLLCKDCSTAVGMNSVDKWIVRTQVG